MAEHVIKMPDVGEGVAEAELVEWHVKVGDPVREDAVLAAVMTDKATVEIPSPVEGKVSWLGAEIGATVAVGAPIVRIEIAGTVQTDEEIKETPTEKAGGVVTRPARPPLEAPKSDPVVALPVIDPAAITGAPRPMGEKPLASPAVRLRAKDASIDLRQVPGSGPAGRISHEDLDTFISRGREPAMTSLRRNTSVENVKIVGLRRKIAEKMTLAKSRIPHITYIEEVDVTELEVLRAKLNDEKNVDRPRLTILPFLMRAMVRAIAEQPQLNARYDDQSGIVQRVGGVHVGVAAQTPGGLVVPVVHHAEARNLWDCAAEVARLTEVAKSGSATRNELSGSTITITSLGAMGGVATTPVINHPEVAIIGVNKIMVRPLWDGSKFVPRKMMNLSSSFDHRIIDGWDAAVFIQRIKALLETPALIFLD